MDARWFRRRELWWPTWRTCVAICLALLLAGFAFVLNVHDWLAVSQPVNDAPYSVVEGWAPNPVPWAAKQWSEQHATKRIFVTGVPMERGMMTPSTITYADITAATLKRMGVDDPKIRAISAKAVNTERTRAMARALREELDAENIPTNERRINLFTYGAHARRSVMHFQNELGPTWQVGVIAVPNPNYPANRWWKYSEGVKAVIEEIVGIVVQTLGAQ